ncbi:MAG: T9SS type A sorting domain-containing protein [Chlorobi bacterium]|nr:T9SS type A sorting domain-containing protein [Chlorobiota bacterium]
MKFLHLFKNFKIFLLSIVLFPFVFSVAQSGLPGAEHPRLFLNDDVIQTLKDRMNANTPEWQMFQAYLDAYIIEDPWGGEYLDGISTFAMAYLLTGNAAYADRSIYFMEKWVDELGATDPFYVGGDEYAHIYENVGLGFDWLYNYAGFTQPQKTDVIDMMNRAYVYGQTPWDQGGGDFEVDPHDSDQIIGGAKTALFWGVATYGDNPSAETMINRNRELWDQNIVPWIIQSYGGVWPEGSQYSYNTLYFLMALTEGERTANGIDRWTENPEISQFPKNLITSLLWLTPPSNDHILTYNDQEDENATYWIRRNHCVAITTFIDENMGFTDEAAYGRYWIRELSPENLEMNVWKLFLWYDRSGNHVNYFNAGLPRAHFSEGTDWMFLRSDWTSNASYSTFCASWTNIDHQFQDGGHFNIFRNGEYLTKQVRHYDFTFLINGKYQIYDGEASNVMLIKSDFEGDERINAMGSAEYLESLGEPAITKYKIGSNPLYAYSSADLGDSYNRVYDEWDGNSQRVSSYARQFVQISPDFYFVYDRIRTVDAGWTKYILHSLTEPAVNGNLITQSSESGNQFLYDKVLYPSNITIEKINEADVWNADHGLVDEWMIPPSVRKWHVAVKPEDAEAVNMLNVIETASGKASEIDNAKLIESEKVIGGQIGNWVVLFSKEETTNGKVNYEISSNSGSLNNLVCDLEPNENYKIILNGAQLQTAAAGEDGTIFFTLNGTGNVSVEKGATGIGDEEGNIAQFKLKQNYPNPFGKSSTTGNNITTIEYTIPNSFSIVHSQLSIYDVLGRKVATPVDEEQAPGNYKVNFDASNLPSGIYFYAIQAGEYFKAKKMTLIK